MGVAQAPFKFPTQEGVSTWRPLRLWSPLVAGQGWGAIFRWRTLEGCSLFSAIIGRAQDCMLSVLQSPLSLLACFLVAPSTVPGGRGIRIWVCSKHSEGAGKQARPKEGGGSKDRS